MATIVRISSLIDSESEFDSAQNDVISYWTDLSKERWFPLPFWQARQLLLASSSGTIALRVKNINDSSSVSGKWMVFEETIADSLTDPVEQGVFYFVLEDNLFDGPVLKTNPVVQVPGLSRITLTPENNIIRARIGKSENEAYALFQVAECILVKPGSGGGGLITGAKIKKKKK